MRVSIVIGFRGSLDDLVFTLKSISVQEFQEFEVIVVDDCNQTPLTADELLPNAKFPIHIIRNSINLGLTKSLIIGCENASGDYIARIDAGDLMVPPSRLATQSAILDANDSIGIVGGALDVADFLNKTIYRSKVVIEPEYSSGDIQKSPPFSHVTIMMRKTVYESAGRYNPEMKVGQDTDLWRRILKKYKGINVDEVFAVAPMQLNSISVKNNSAQIRAKIKRLSNDYLLQSATGKLRISYMLMSEFLKLMIPIKTRIRMRYRRNMKMIKQFKQDEILDLDSLYERYIEKNDTD